MLSLHSGKNTQRRFYTQKPAAAAAAAAAAAGRTQKHKAEPSTSRQSLPQAGKAQHK